jgi:hypothetical protein
MMTGMSRVVLLAYACAFVAVVDLRIGVKGVNELELFTGLRKNDWWADLIGRFD